MYDAPWQSPTVGPHGWQDNALKDGHWALPVLWVQQKQEQIQVLQWFWLLSRVGRVPAAVSKSLLLLQRPFVL